ncbi:MAG: hypothetical protein DPW18_06975 [Chloroflexi bacterium]|nr:hypothetical protein [Chloroflexota bacterium]MDL1941548.1 hypothetical protein [Chloroflexi bacterium CFX2]
MLQKKLLFPLFAVLAIFVSACAAGGGSGGGTADLIPVMASGNPTFCEREEDTLFIYVKNSGSADAASAEVQVEFFLGPGYTRTENGTTVTGILAAGETLSSPIAVSIPGDCFNPDCDFKITIDPSNAVKESDESNNAVEAACIG